MLGMEGASAQLRLVALEKVVTALVNARAPRRTIAAASAATAIALFGGAPQARPGAGDRGEEGGAPTQRRRRRKRGGKRGKRSEDGAAPAAPGAAAAAALPPTMEVDEDADDAWVDDWEDARTAAERTATGGPSGTAAAASTAAPGSSAAEAESVRDTAGLAATVAPKASSAFAGSRSRGRLVAGQKERKPTVKEQVRAVEAELAALAREQEVLSSDSEGMG